MLENYVPITILYMCLWLLEKSCRTGVVLLHIWVVIKCFIMVMLGHIPHIHNFTYYYELDVYMSKQWSSSIKCNWLKLLFKLSGRKRKEIKLMRVKLYNQLIKHIMLRSRLISPTHTHLSTFKNVTFSFFPTITAMIQAVSYFSSIHMQWTNHLHWHSPIRSCHPFRKPPRASHCLRGIGSTHHGIQDSSKFGLSF